ALPSTRPSFRVTAVVPLGDASRFRQARLVGMSFPNTRKLDAVIDEGISGRSKVTAIVVPAGANACRTGLVDTTCRAAAPVVGATRRRTRARRARMVVSSRAADSDRTRPHAAERRRARTAPSRARALVTEHRRHVQRGEP